MVEAHTEQYEKKRDNINLFWRKGGGGGRSKKLSGNAREKGRKLLQLLAG